MTMTNLLSIYCVPDSAKGLYMRRLTLIHADAVISVESY